jgi:hypothetical protein
MNKEIINYNGQPLIKVTKDEARNSYNFYQRVYPLPANETAGTYPLRYIASKTDSGGVNKERPPFDEVIEEYRYHNCRENEDVKFFVEKVGICVTFSYFEIMETDFTGIEVEIGDEVYTNFDRSELDDRKQMVYLNQKEFFVFPTKELAKDIILSGLSYELKNERTN